MAAENLEQRHFETTDLVSRSEELVAILDSGEPVIKDVTKLSALTSEVTDKVKKTKETVTSTTQGKLLQSVTIMLT